MVVAMQIIQIILSITVGTLVLLQAKGAGLGSIFGGDSGVYRTRRGVARSAALHYWNCSIESPLLETLSRRHAQLIKRISELFLTAAGKLGGRPSKQRSAFALKMVLVSCREHFLFAHQSKTLRFSNQEFESELAEMVIGHLKMSGKRK